MFSFPVKSKVELAPYTTFKIGGPANYFFMARTQTQLKKIIQEAKAKQIPYFILGNGSNILVSDEGFKGLVIKNEIDYINFNNQEVAVGSGTKIGILLSKCKEQGLSGLEFLASIPATMGGAVWANAGSYQQRISQFIKVVKILDENNQEQILKLTDRDFSYRDSIFKHKNYIILEVVLTLIKAKPPEIEEKIKQYARQKASSQPLAYPSIGSIFKNPASDKPAWKLIDQVGLRGYQIGSAQISTKHSNFIINTGQATASDVIMLISLIKQKVRDNLGVQLQEEIKYIGFNN